MIIKKEFEERLINTKVIDDLEEDIEYKLPVLQYYLKNYINFTIQTNDSIINLNEIPIIRSNKEGEWQLIDQAFYKIKQRFINN
jgi:hypothetical protein